MQEIFSKNADYTKTALLNWRMEGNLEIRNFLNLADGFLRSSVELAKICLRNNKDKKADILIFPILTNANHGIELYLKSLNWMLNKIINSEKRIEGRHNIRQIFQTVRAKIEKNTFNITLSDFNSATKNLESYITELFNKIEASAKDDKMDFSRYSFNNEYEDHFYVGANENIEIDLENFVSRFKNIHYNFELLTDYFYYNELYLDR